MVQWFSSGRQAEEEVVALNTLEQGLLVLVMVPGPGHLLLHLYYCRLLLVMM